MAMMTREQEDAVKTKFQELLQGFNAALDNCSDKIAAQSLFTATGKGFMQWLEAQKPQIDKEERLNIIYNFNRDMREIIEQHTFESKTRH